MLVLLPAEAKDDLLSGAFVCRHKAGNWNAVSADQFGEQTAIKIGKVGPKGITLSSTQVAKSIGSFPYLHIFLTRLTIATLQICQAVPARRRTRRKV